MKKLLNRLFTIALAAIAINTFDLSASANKRYQSNRRNTTRVSAQRRSMRPQTRRIRQQRRPAPLKDPVARKQETQLNQKIKTNTQALAAAVDQEKKASNSAEKALAQKTAAQLANELLANLKEERNFINDVYGYDAIQIKKAQLMLTKLYPIKQQVRDALIRKEAELAQVTDKGFIWNAAQKGKEKEYNSLSLEVNKLKGTLTRVENTIGDQEVITGQVWSNAYKTLLATGAIVAGTIGADLAITGGAGTMAVGSKAVVLAKNAPAWAQQKFLSAWNAMPNWRKIPTPTIEINRNTAQIDGKTIEKAAVSSQFGSLLADATWGVLGMAKEMIVRTAVSSAFTLAVKKLYEMLEDPKTTPAQLEKQNKLVQDLAAKEQAKQK